MAGKTAASTVCQRLTDWEPNMPDHLSRHHDGGSSITPAEGHYDRPGRPAGGYARRRRADVSEIIRAFENKPVPDDLIAVFLKPRWALSGSNIQPWKVHVLNGTARRNIRMLCSPRRETRIARDGVFLLRTRMARAFLARRTSSDFSAMGIARDDRKARHDAFVSNFVFRCGNRISFDPSDLEHGRADYGTFIQSISIAARGWGLSTIAQGALAISACRTPNVRYRRRIHPYRRHEHWLVLNAPVNLFQPDRIDVTNSQPG